MSTRVKEDVGSEVTAAGTTWKKTGVEMSAETTGPATWVSKCLSERLRCAELHSSTSATAQPTAVRCDAERRGATAPAAAAAAAPLSLR